MSLLGKMVEITDVNQKQNKKLVGKQGFVISEPYVNHLDQLVIEVDILDVRDLFVFKLNHVYFLEE